MRPWAVVLLAFLAVRPVTATPVQAGARLTPAGTCYRDHRDPALWYLGPAAPTLTDASGRSTVELTLFRYHGSSTTADADAFQAGGILQFRLAFHADPGRMARASRALGGGVRVVPLPLSRVEASVVFPGTEPRPASEAGEKSASWEERSFSLRLTPADQALLRRAWRGGATTLSVNVAAWAMMRPAPGSGSDREAPEEVPVLVEAVPITFSGDDRRIRHIDLEAGIPADYTGLQLGCAEVDGPDDTVAMVARVRATAVNGDTLERTVSFRPGGPVVRTVRFDAAVRLDGRYAVWIGRKLATGELEPVDERTIPVWQGFLDICATNAGREDRLDPRMLY